MGKNKKSTDDIMDVSYTPKKLEYLEKHCALLEKENEQLKNEKLAVEMQLESYRQGLNVSIPATKNILMKSIVSIKMNRKLNKELQEKINKVNTMLLELTNIKTGYKSNLSKSVDKVLGEITKKHR